MSGFSLVRSLSRSLSLSRAVTTSSLNLRPAVHVSVKLDSVVGHSLDHTQKSQFVAVSNLLGSVRYNSTSEGSTANTGPTSRKGPGHRQGGGGQRRPQRGQGRGRDVKQAEIELPESEQLKLKAALTDLLCESEGWQRGLARKDVDLIQEYHRRAERPNGKSYNLLGDLVLAGLQKDRDRVMRRWNEICGYLHVASRYLPADEVKTWGTDELNSMVRAFANVGQVSLCKSFISNMHSEARYKVTAKTYAPLIEFFYRTKDLDRMERALTKMLYDNIPFDGHGKFYLYVLELAGEEGRVELAEQWYEGAKEDDDLSADEWAAVSSVMETVYRRNGFEGKADSLATMSAPKQKATQ